MLFSHDHFGFGARVWASRKAPGWSDATYQHPRADSHRKATTMAVSTPKRSKRSKYQLAEKLSERSGELLIRYEPAAICTIDATSNKSDPTSKGHVYVISAAEFGEFPDFGFCVLVDDRHNGGDLAQSIADELLAIAEGYLAVAKRVAERLNRTPKRPKFRWEDLKVNRS